MEKNIEVMLHHAPDEVLDFVDSILNASRESENEEMTSYVEDIRRMVEVVVLAIQKTDQIEAAERPKRRVVGPKCRNLN